MSKKLEELKDKLDYIRLAQDRESIVTLLDSNSVVLAYSIPDNVKPAVSIGQKFHDPTGAFDKCMRTGKVVHNIIPKENLGSAMEGNLIPVKDGSSVVGCVISTYNVDGKEKVTEISNQFQDTVSSVNTSIQEMVEGFQELFGMLNNMTETTTTVSEDVKTASTVTGKIASAASRSNILALNASIEAARSGEAGKGFAVVANEMGNLAKESGNSSAAIKTTLDNIIQHLSGITEEITHANDVAKSHIDNISNIKEKLDDMKNLSDSLGKYVQ